MSATPGGEAHLRAVDAGLVASLGVRVMLERDGPQQAWGFTLTGGREHRKPLIVAKVQPHSPAAGKVGVGEEVILINGVDVRHAQHAHAVYLVKGARYKLTLNLDRHKFNRTNEWLLHNVHPQTYISK